MTNDPSDDNFDDLVADVFAHFKDVLPGDRTPLAFGTVSLDVKRSTAHCHVEWPSLQIMHNSISQMLVESVAGAAAANCLRGLGEDANSEDAFSGRAEKRVAELRTRAWTLVPEITEASIRFIYTAAFQLDATGFTTEVLCFSVGNEELSDLYYADGTYVFNQAVARQVASHAQVNRARFVLNRPSPRKSNTRQNVGVGPGVVHRAVKRRRQSGPNEAAQHETSRKLWRLILRDSLTRYARSK